MRILSVLAASLALALTACSVPAATNGDESVQNGKPGVTAPPRLAFDDESPDTSIEVVEAPAGKGLSDVAVVVTESTGSTTTVEPPAGKGM